MAEKPEEGTRLTAAQIHENVLRPAEHEIRRTAAALLWSSLAAGLVTLRLVGRIWGLLLVGNLVGTVLFGLTVARTGVLRPEYAAELLDLSRAATDGSFWRIAYAAVFAGWLMALLAWLLASTTDTMAQIVFIWLCTAPISALDLPHSIAGATEAFYRAALADASWGTMLGGFVLPAVLGNAVGGVLLVALLNYGQVLADRDGEAV